MHKLSTKIVDNRVEKCAKVTDRTIGSTKSRKAMRLALQLVEYRCIWTAFSHQHQ